MSDAPKKIWLQRPCRDPENEWCGEVTWCDSRENEDDTEYVRSDVANAIIDRYKIAMKHAKLMQNALVQHRLKMFPCTDQYDVVRRDYPIDIPHELVEGEAG